MCMSCSISTSESAGWRSLRRTDTWRTRPDAAGGDEVREYTRRNFMAGRNREIEIIKLNGSIELAPILGLSDVIVDIVETGNTLQGEPSERDRGVREHQREVHREQDELQIRK